eukprot:TRINITY_DN849_c0_g1_i1.p1 TRINITY_DN849_c0_g1~~TRINITY_DN849_c0_g1_i1.p1  ORF type:complete len:165 (-),score=28.87 TRINITY_DN849_c0_g1_i1:70-564(-)
MNRIYITVFLFIAFVSCQGHYNCPDTSKYSGYAVFNISIVNNAFSVSYQPSPYPEGLNKACFTKNIADNVTIYYQTPNQASYLFLNNFRYNPVPMNLDASDNINECYANRFPFNIFNLLDNHSCIGAIPWCNPQFFHDYDIVFRAPGVETYKIHIKCRGENFQK